MNICLISREYPGETGWGGIGTYTYHLAHGLSKLGHKVVVITQGLEADKEYMDKSVWIYRTKHKILFEHKESLKDFFQRLEYSKTVYAKISELITKWRFDIIEGPNLSGEAFIYSLFKKAPLVTRLHTHFSEVISFLGWEITQDLRLSCWIEDATILRSDLVTCSTRQHAGIIFSNLVSCPENVEIIPLGVPLPTLDRQNKVNQGKWKVLYVGRLEKRKGIQVLIKAIPEILQQVPDTEFNIIGRDSYVNGESVSFTGRAEDSFQRKLLKDIPRQYLKKIKFIGYAEDKQLEEYYQSCDVFVAPSLYESFGFIYIEAMSYAKPVVGCSVGGVPEVIKDGETGILVAPEDHYQLTQAIIRLLKNKELRVRMGINARKHVEANFTREQMVQKTLDTYRKVINVKNNKRTR
ncbi:MAG: glycosyltransferase family 4 protein [Candidatus Omnitrophota bacterium]